MSSPNSNTRAMFWMAGVGLGLAAVAVSVATVPTTPADFFGPGTQPAEIQETIIDAATCRICHGDYMEAHDLARPWAASMMGQAARDPVFWAGVAVANQDAAGAGELCIRCHVPVGWLSGHSSPSDGSSLTGWDFDGVSCIMCHRMVDPVYHPGQSPEVDQDILASLQHPQVSTGNNTAVIDPLDRRRGPFAITAEYHRWLQSPFHQTANMCGNCHEVSNPALSKQTDGSFKLNPLDAPHPTGDKYEMFPLDRTFSEWSQSAFAQGPIDMDGRFGGNKFLVSTCQDCHMPDGSGVAANPILGPDFRDDLPQHTFLGSNSWVLRAVRNLYEDEETGLSRDDITATLGRTASFMQAASDMELTRAGRDLNVRIINQSGHKLPTGYHEGRRMWVNVKFFDALDQLVAEHGAYDTGTATLSTSDTKVYETKQGLDQWMSLQTGIPEGISFHQALNNKIYRDNRIPPRGFTNAGFASVQCEPVAYAYADGQYWDDTPFHIPPTARRAEARFYYQTTSREYIEFLRDQNTTNTAGQVAYDQWLYTGKSAPGLMDSASIALCPADFNSDGQVDFFDYLDFVNLFSTDDPEADFNGDGQVDFFDYLDFAQSFADDC
jgi:hypothetical protein